MSVKNKYRILQCLYWMSGCVAWGYFISYLDEYGFSARVSGLIAAAFALAAALLQPFLGRLADKSSRFHWKQILLLLDFMTLACLVALLFCNAKAAVGILFGAVSMLVTAILSMVNVACFYYEHRGVAMNFGFARALGSLAYAVLSVILGKLIAPCGIKVVVIAGILIFAAEILLVFTMPYEGPAKAAAAAEEKKKTGFGVFFRRYPAFILMVAACALFLTFHDMYTNYLLRIMEKVGGGNEDLGIALALAAAVEIPVMILSGWLVKKMRSYWLLVVSGAALVVRGFAYLAAGTVMEIYLIQVVFQVLTFALIASIGVYFTDETVAEEDLATGQSFMGMTMACGNTIGFFVGGNLIDTFGVDAMLETGTAISAVGTGLAVISALMLTRKVKRRKCAAG
ncbi:MAG: MFS transporter [Lachnospiraceae bacterium]|nr:MFS transporter [Lachnospiraceae bacterium]